MDPTETARAVMRRHQPSRWWIVVGIRRCQQGCGRWPCGFWHNARDQRDRILDEAAIARMLLIVAGLEPNRPRRGVHDAQR